MQKTILDKTILRIVQTNEKYLREGQNKKVYRIVISKNMLKDLKKDYQTFSYYYKKLKLKTFFKQQFGIELIINNDNNCNIAIE